MTGLARRRGALAVLAATLAVSPALAGASQWFDHEGGRVRIVSMTAEDGMVRGYLDIELEPGWKTYWRDPGETGIPPSLTVEEGPAEAKLFFPAPERIEDGSGKLAGYGQSMRLPLTLANTDEAAIDVSLFMGICETICVPVSETIAIDPGEETSAIEAALIEQAFADLPEAPTDEFNVEAVSRDAESSSLKISVRFPSPAAAEDGEIFIAAPDGWRLGLPERASTEGPLTRFMVPLQDAPEKTDDGTFSIVATTLARSMEETVRLP